MDQQEDAIVYDEDTLRLMKMFHDRDDAYTTATQAIVDQIGPTVLEALYELFRVPVEQVKWLDFQSTDNLLIIICAIQYDPSVFVPPFVDDIRVDSLPVDKPSVVSQTVRIGIPFEVVMTTSETIYNFLSALVDSHKSGGPTLIQQMGQTSTEKPARNKQPQQTTPVELSLDQKMMLLTLQRQTRRKIH